MTAGAAPAPPPSYPPRYPPYAPPPYAPPPYAPSPYAGYPIPYTPYGPYAMPWPGYFVVAPRRSPSETYALVVSWIVTFAGALSIICGLLISIITFLSILGGSNSLTSVDTFFCYLFAPVVGGGFAIYYGICGIQRRPSPRFTLPSPLLLLALTVVVYGAAIILWHLSAAPGPAFLALPLVVLSAAMPALTILSFATWRLKNPTSRRHVWMSFIYGSTLAILIALILNTIGEVAVALFEYTLEPHAVPNNPVNPSSLDNVEIIGALVLLSVLAPLVEEGVKPLGTLLAIRRLRSPAGAFLMGLAAGCGFAIFESVSIYIGQGQADWVVVALERVGTGLLHGVGAGMGALGWYYLVNGKGVRLRWWRAIGCFVYALLQHGIFNALALVVSLPGPISNWLSHPVYIGSLPLDRSSFVFFIYYAIIIAVLVTVTGRLALIPGPPVTTPVTAGNNAGPAPSVEAMSLGSTAR